MQRAEIQDLYTCSKTGKHLDTLHSGMIVSKNYESCWLLVTGCEGELRVKAQNSVLLILNS